MRTPPRPQGEASVTTVREHAPLVKCTVKEVSLNSFRCALKKCQEPAKRSSHLFGPDTINRYRP
eukprot:1292669-Amphidinium_carterae.1